MNLLSIHVKRIRNLPLTKKQHFEIWERISKFRFTKKKTISIAFSQVYQEKKILIVFFKLKSLSSIQFLYHVSIYVRLND